MVLGDSFLRQSTFVNKHNWVIAATLKKRTRFSRTDWLARAMDVLSRKGGARLRINDLCQELGVTKGSFYAHFEDRADFVRQFVAYWAETFTQSVVNEIDKLADVTAKARLLALMRLLHHEKMARYDVAVRAWAAQESSVAQEVRKVDKLRFAYIRQIFHEMGFRGADLDLRTRLFVGYHSSEPGIQLPPSGLGEDEEIKLRHAFFTRP